MLSKYSKKLINDPDGGRAGMAMTPEGYGQLDETGKSARKTPAYNIYEKVNLGQHEIRQRLQNKSIEGIENTKRKRK